MLREMQKMDSTKNKYANRPNLLRVATELAGYKNPGKILSAAKLVLEGSIDNSANSNQDLGLLSG